MKYDCTLSDTCFGVANAYILDMTRRADSISPLRMRIRARESGSVSAAPQDESKIHEIRAGKRAADIGCRQVQPRDRPSISIRRGCSQMQHLSSSMPSVTEERGGACHTYAICDDLPSGDHDYVQNDHAAPLACRRKLLDIQRGYARRQTDTNSDEEATANLG